MKRLKRDKIPALLAECDQLLKAGRAADATKMLKELTTRRVAKGSRLELARLCRRAGLVGPGLRLLTASVRDKNASDKEIAEYAVLLQRYGGAREALARLSKVDSNVVPEAQLYRAFCHFNLWQYEEAIPSLQAYIKTCSDPYMELVGNVNLSAALLAVGRLKEAEALLESNAEVAAKGSYARLRGNCLELLGQTQIQQGHFAKASEYLSSAAKVFGDAQVHDQLFVRKWQAVLDALTSHRTEPLELFRNEAHRRNEPEAVREADMYILKVRFDEPKFEFLYFGTPFQSYRERISTLLGRTPAQSTYALGGPGSLSMDVASGELSDGRSIAHGSKGHQLLEVLLRDFYRPLRIAEVFSEVFPNEYFDIFSSPHRVEQLVHRLRQWIEQESLPVELITANGRLQLKQAGQIAFVVPLIREPVDPYRGRLIKLRKLFSSDAGFTAAEARQAVGLTPAEFKRFASRAVDQGDMDRFGMAKATTYFLKDSE